MTQIKLDPAFRRQMPEPRVGGLKPAAQTPEPSRHRWLKLVLSVLIAMFVGAGIVSSWVIVTAWLGLSH